jgi:hypothetical protein
MLGFSLSGDNLRNVIGDLEDVMKTKVTEQGVLVPKRYFKGIEEVEIRKENNLVVVVPVTDDPILQLGRRPVSDDIKDGSENHDKYIYGK